MKTEPDCFSIDDLARLGRTSWEGVRNYQARNFMRDDMRAGDLVLFYHSSAEPPGVAGVARVCAAAHPDPTALDPQSQYFDPKATAENPIWMMVDVAFVEKFPHFVELAEMRGDASLTGMGVLQRGSRLSILPVEPDHFRRVVERGRSRRPRPRRTS